LTTVAPSEIFISKSRDIKKLEYQTVVREENKIEMECEAYNTTIIKTNEYEF
jgi:hypothetical protein